MALPKNKTMFVGYLPELWTIENNRSCFSLKICGSTSSSKNWMFYYAMYVVYVLYVMYVVHVMYVTHDIQLMMLKSPAKTNSWLKSPWGDIPRSQAVNARKNVMLNHLLSHGPSCEEMAVNWVGDLPSGNWLLPSQLDITHDNFGDLPSGHLPLCEAENGCWVGWFTYEWWFAIAMLANRRVVTRLVKRLLNGMIHQVTKCALAYNGKTRKSGHFHGVLGIYCPYRTKKIKVSVFCFLLLLFVVLRYVYHKPQKLLSSVCQVGGSSLPPEKYTRKSMEIIGPFVARYSMSGSKGFC